MPAIRRHSSANGLLVSFTETLASQSLFLGSHSSPINHPGQQASDPGQAGQEALLREGKHYK